MSRQIGYTLGVSNPRQTILETLSQHGPLPIAEIARAARHSVLATRYHVGLLVDEGLVSADTVARKSTVGRPQALYALADRAHDHLPKQYAALAEQLLAEIQTTLGEKEQRALLRRAGKRIASTASAPHAARVTTRLARAVDFLTERGYMAQWEKSQGEYRLHVCNCPYRQIALAHPVCDMDLALIGALLDAPLKMTHCIASQQNRCTFVVKPAKS